MECNIVIAEPVRGPKDRLISDMLISPKHPNKPEPASALHTYPLSWSHHDGLRYSIDPAVHGTLGSQLNQEDPEVGASKIQCQEPPIL
ncbi:hypothetical protein E2C01_005548 [Portunus trituberculatus]|uniref:Uncharacterized protein n=1 Tax=Portunus trituberculatus TaxID=210409 RepID=A0A5B7CVT1_PORTR|nr:hypothetical protein [Portunus trituberculatus]